MSVIVNEKTYVLVDLRLGLRMDFSIMSHSKT